MLLLLSSSLDYAMRRVAAPKKKETVVQTERERESELPREGWGGVKNPPSFAALCVFAM